LGVTGSESLHRDMWVLCVLFVVVVVVAFAFAFAFDDDDDMT
jgi:hypothetical protein